MSKASEAKKALGGVIKGIKVIKESITEIERDIRDVYYELGDLIQQQATIIIKIAPLHQIKSRYKNKRGAEYILARVDTSLCGLICLANGERWRAPVLVGDAYNITEEEFSHISASGEFTLIPRGE